MKDKQGEIVDEICEVAGINERRRPNSPTLDKKEALQVLAYINALRGIRDRRRT